MSGPNPDAGQVRIVIRRLEIHARSSIDARRLADGIVPALERILGDPGPRGAVAPGAVDRPRPATGRPSRHVDIVADAIAAAIAEHVARAEAAR